MQTENRVLSEFSDREKVAYLSAIASIATADRVASEDEIEFLQALGQTAGLTDEQEQEVLTAANDSSNDTLLQHLNVLRDSDLRFSLIADIISFAKADGEYTPEEESRIKEVAANLGIEEKQYNTLNLVADKAQQAQQAGQDVTQPGFLQSSGIGDMLQKAGISPGMLKGMLGIAAPLLLGRMFGGSAGVGRAAGVVGGGLLGTLLSGGLGNIFGNRGGSGGGGLSGGLGSIFSILRGGKGYSGFGGSSSSSSGGLGSILGKLFGRRG
ncbi:MAG: TerB family tellurite resistance protein [Bacteroidota bacterium]